MTINVINDSKMATVETTDDSLFQALSYDLPVKCSAKATLSVISRNSDNGDTFSIEQKFVAKRLSGASSIVGEVVASMDAQFDSSMGTNSVAVSTSGTSLIISVTGILATTIDWVVQLQIMVEQDNSA